MSRGRTAAPRGDLRRMISVLAQERDALLTADFARLDRLAPRKGALLARLEASLPGAGPADGALADTMRAAAARNATLCESALAGVREAGAMIERARNPVEGRVYGRGGERRTLDEPAGKLERRA